jgi:hypothetical protein
MLDKEALVNAVKLATQNAWRRDTLTTVNSIVEFIVNEAVNALVDQLNDKFALMQKDIDELYTISSMLDDELRTKEEVDGGKDGRLQKPKRGPKAQNGSTYAVRPG